MKMNMKSLDNITWDRPSDENAVTYPSLSPTDPGQAIVFGDGFPRAGACEIYPRLCHSAG